MYHNFLPVYCSVFVAVPKTFVSDQCPNFLDALVTENRHLYVRLCRRQLQGKKELNKFFSESSLEALI